MITLNLGTFKLSKDFTEGSLAYDFETDSVLICVHTDTNSPKAFRQVFKKQGSHWLPCYGSLKRFGSLREMNTVYIS